MSKPAFRDAARLQTSILTPWEKKTLHWIAVRLPSWVNSDHLTSLGFFSMFMAGACYAAAGKWPLMLLAVNLWLAVNWFGDSLDGTLARVRQKLRPRYGFYVDHIVDAFGATFLLSGLALSGYMSFLVAFTLLITYLLLSIDLYLATYTLGKFELSFGIFGPTELRILLAIGNIFVLYKPRVKFSGDQYLFFDIGGAVASVCIAAVAIFSVIRHTRTLYLAEKIN
jgi:phosphatidylglycerophosphate synthase